MALAKLGVSALANAHLVAANVEAMSASVTLSDHLDADSILAMHAALLRHSRPQDAGRWRSQQVWIGSWSISPADAVFVPAHHDRVPDAVADLVDFMRRDDLPVVVQAAIAHALFETIHPFPHGNGRTGRALLHALLRNKGLIRRVTVPISSGCSPIPGATLRRSPPIAAATSNRSCCGCLRRPNEPQPAALGLSTNSTDFTPGGRAR